MVWLVSEILLIRFKRSKTTETRRDSFTIRIIWLLIAVAVGGGIFIAAQPYGSFGGASTASRYAGVGLIIAGVLFRWSAILTLKSQFTVDVAIIAQHKLVIQGIYRYLRHQSYTGSLLSFVGLGFAFANWMSLILIVVLVSLAFLKRIQVEEKVLHDQFGAEYERYCASTKRLIPFVY